MMVAVMEVMAMTGMMMKVVTMNNDDSDNVPASMYAMIR